MTFGLWMDFKTGKIKSVVVDMKPAQRVAARTLVDLKLLEVVEVGGSRVVKATKLGDDLLDAARSLPI